MIEDDDVKPSFQRRIETAIGEDPGRFLIGQFGPIDVPPLVDRRIRGIDYIRTAVGWLWLETEYFDRQGVIDRLDRRIDWLEEHGERPDRIVGERDSDSIPEKDEPILRRYVDPDDDEYEEIPYSDHSNPSYGYLKEDPTATGDLS